MLFQSMVFDGNIAACRIKLKAYVLPPVLWSGQQDLNLRPSVPQTDALPGCAMARDTFNKGFKSCGKKIMSSNICFSIQQINLVQGHYVSGLAFL